MAKTSSFAHPVLSLVRHLTETFRIEILMILGFGDRCLIQVEEVDLFNETPDLAPLSQGTVSKIEQQFRELDLYQDYRAIDILLSTEENLTVSSHQIVNEHNISHATLFGSFPKLEGINRGQSGSPIGVGNLTGRRYLELFQDEIGPALEVMYPNRDQDIPNATILYQQDATPPHYALPVRPYLDATFPSGWIGRRAFIEWPVRTPDL